jgi:hypothetical protein
MTGSMLDDNGLDARLRAGVPRLTEGAAVPAWEDISPVHRHPSRAPVLVLVAVFVLLIAGALVVGERQERSAGTVDGPAEVEIVDVDQPLNFDVEAQALPDAGLGAREGASGVWTGRQYLVWGGWRSYFPTDGAAYDPGAQTWTPIPEAPIRGRQGHVSVWTGSEMIVWGGSGLPPGRGAPPGSEDGPLTDGAAYDPLAGIWRPIASAPAVARAALPVRAVVVGRYVVVALGPTYSEPSVTLVYDRVADAWRAIDRGFADIAAVGDVVVGVRGGAGRTEEVTIAALDPATGRVDELGPFPEGKAERATGIVGVPGGVVVVAGASFSTYLGRYDLAAARWTTMHRAKGSAALDSFGMGAGGQGELHGLDGQVAVMGAGSLFVFDPASATARVAGFNRSHCVGPNASTVWTGREWFQFGGLGACGGDPNVVGVKGHALRLTMGPPRAGPPSRGPGIWLLTVAIVLALALALAFGRRRRRLD